MKIFFGIENLQWLIYMVDLPKKYAAAPQKYSDRLRKKKSTKGSLNVTSCLRRLRSWLFDLLRRRKRRARYQIPHSHGHFQEFLQLDTQVSSKASNGFESLSYNNEILSASRDLAQIYLCVLASHKIIHTDLVYFEKCISAYHYSKKRTDFRKNSEIHAWREFCVASWVSLFDWQSTGFPNLGGSMERVGEKSRRLGGQNQNQVSRKRHIVCVAISLASNLPAVTTSAHFQSLSKQPPQHE